MAAAVPVEELIVRPTLEVRGVSQVLLGNRKFVIGVTIFYLAVLAAAFLWRFRSGGWRRIELVEAELPARAVRRGWLDGFRLCFNLAVGPGERGVANIEATVGESICGALYLLTPSDCDRLDRTEGVHVGAYSRFPVDVRLDDGSTCAAFTYRSRFASAGPLSASSGTARSASRARTWKRASAPLPRTGTVSAPRRPCSATSTATAMRR